LAPRPGPGPANRLVHVDPEADRRRGNHLLRRPDPHPDRFRLEAAGDDADARAGVVLGLAGGFGPGDLDAADDRTPRRDAFDERSSHDEEHREPDQARGDPDPGVSGRGSRRSRSRGARR
jgi:hypothetical protein